MTTISIPTNVLYSLTKELQETASLLRDRDDLVVERYRYTVLHDFINKLLSEKQVDKLEDMIRVTKDRKNVLFLQSSLLKEVHHE